LPPAPAPGPTYTYTYTKRSQQQLPELGDALSSVHRLQMQQPAAYQVVHSTTPYRLSGQRPVMVGQNGQVLVPVTLAPRGSIVAQRTQQLLPHAQHCYMVAQPHGQPQPQPQQGPGVLLQVARASGATPQGQGGSSSSGLLPRQQQPVLYLTPLQPAPPPPQQPPTSWGFFAQQLPPPPSKPFGAAQPPPSSPSATSCSGDSSAFEAAVALSAATPPRASQLHASHSQGQGQGQGLAFRAPEAQALIHMLPPGLHPRQPTGP
jgi:hypothetical protein